jgi:uracil-DNA glycosylase
LSVPNATETVLQEVAERIAGCQSCALAKTRQLTVPGEGPAGATIMCIGEAPGFHENRQGRPFVGQAGNFLQDLLAAIGLTRQDVFIANVIKCRPPENRDPLPEEMLACAGYLDAQIAAIKPKIIVTLGRFSMARYFPGETISRVHGVARKRGDVICFAMYHPAAALHNPALKQVLLADIQKLRPILDEIRAREAEAAKVASAPEPAAPLEQLNLF